MKTIEEYFSILSSIITGSFYVWDIPQKRFCYIKPDDLFLCGYPVEEVMMRGYDFYPRIIHPEDQSVWTNMLEAILLYLKDSEEDVHETDYFSCTFRLLRKYPFMPCPLPQMIYLNQRTAFKSISCHYTHIPILDSTYKYKNGFSYEITVCSPINKQLFEKSIKIMKYQDMPYGYIFNISSVIDYQKAEELVKEYHIEKYQLKPIYTGDNILFFKDNIFLTKEDILSSHITMKDFFTKRLINKNDFGKLHIMQNGDVYANINHPTIGNIFTNSIDEIIQKELKEGKSWLRIRNQDPCDKCLYQDLCPSPSDYEIEIGYPNLCHVQLDHL